MVSGFKASRVQILVLVPYCKLKIGDKSNCVASTNRTVHNITRMTLQIAT